VAEEMGLTGRTQIVAPRNTGPAVIDGA